MSKELDMYFLYDSFKTIAYYDNIVYRYRWAKEVDKRLLNDRSVLESSLDEILGSRPSDLNRPFDFYSSHHLRNQLLTAITL